MYGDDEDGCDTSRSGIYSKQSERTQLQLAKVDQNSKLFIEAEVVFKDIDTAKIKYYEVLSTLDEREKAIASIEQRFLKVAKANER